MGLFNWGSYNQEPERVDHGHHRHHGPHKHHGPPGPMWFYSQESEHYGSSPSGPTQFGPHHGNEEGLKRRRFCGKKHRQDYSESDPRPQFFGHHHHHGPWHEGNFEGQTQGHGHRFHGCPFRTGFFKEYKPVFNKRLWD